jgi:phage-related holin
MKEIWNAIQLAFAAIGGWLGYFLGGCDGLLYALILFVVADYITGVMCAINDKALSSEVGFRGICRKVLIFLRSADSGDLLLPVQRGRVPGGECRPPGSACP